LELVDSSQEGEMTMKVARVVAGGLLVLALAVVIAGVLARRQTVSGVQEGDRPRVGRAVPAAAIPLPPTPTLPPLPTPLPTVPLPPTPRQIDPDVTNAVPLQGVPGIAPSRPMAAPDRPTFSEDDVRAYIAKHGIGPSRVRASGPYQIERVEFLRGSEAPSRLGVRVGVADDRLVCAATLQGTFTVLGPPAGGSQEYTKSKVILFFDARTGNLLGQDALP
jgi:hypothetical protein